MMGFGEFLMIALTAVTAAGSFVFALVMSVKDVWLEDAAKDVQKVVKAA
ncbi:MAG: hypothetical protein RRY12_05285 [Cloacibacillus sp.]